MADADDATRRQLDPRYDPVFQRGYDGPVLVTPAAQPAREPTPTVDPAAIAAAPVELDGDRPPWRPNPFLRAIQIASPLLVLCGLLLYWTALHTSYSSGGGEPAFSPPMLLLEIGALLAPAMVTIGLASAVGLVFYGAVVRRRR